MRINVLEVPSLGPLCILIHASPSSHSHCPLLTLIALFSHIFPSSYTPFPLLTRLSLLLQAAFERQQEEIDALHRAQERAEARVSFIHSELKDSEQELVILGE